MAQISRLALGGLLAATLVHSAGASTLLAGSPAARTASFQDADGPAQGVQLVIPFYEGIVIEHPAVALRTAALTRFQLAYPSPMSAPFVAWREGKGAWTVLYADTLTACPTALDVEVAGTEVRLKLSSGTDASVERMEVEGSWEAMVRAVRQKWNVQANRPRLSDRYDRINFYVHQWVSEKGNPPLRVDWKTYPLEAEMGGVPPRTLAHVYGLDPGGVDLGGRCLWSEGSEQMAKALVAANPKVSHLCWLNLRTFKTAIPRLDVHAPAEAEARDSAKWFDGRIRSDDNYAYQALDMCAASEWWQASRLREFDKLAGIGFKVVQLDEFPIPPVWHVAACGAKGHLHRPGDAADEWEKAIALVARLAARAAERDVLLTCEEPSAALLPFVSGYLDRQYNDGIDIYGVWKKSKTVETIPLFSTMFGDLVTPYTDADGLNPARQPPAGWLQAHKISPRR